MKEFIPDACRGRVQGNAVIYSALVSISGMVAISLLIHHANTHNWQPELPFQIAFVIFPLIALAGVFGTKHLPGGDAPQRRKSVRLFVEGQLRAARNSSFRCYVLAEGLIFGITALFAGLMPVFLLTVARIPDTQIVLLGGAQMAGIIISGSLNGRSVDRLGSRRILPRFLLALSIMPLLWLLLPLLGSWCVPSACAAYFLFGFFQNGTIIALVRMLYNDIVPRRHRTEYFTLRYAGSGLLAGFFPLLGGLSIDWMKQAGSIGVMAYIPAFLASTIAAVVAMSALSSIPSQESIPTKFAFATPSPLKS
jgi:Na+/melibiose symporter-like transporter